MHGPTCIFWANLTPFSLKFRSPSGWAVACGVLDELDRRLLPADLLSTLERFKLAIYETVDEEVAGSAVVAGDDMLGRLRRGPFVIMPPHSRL